MLHLRLFLLLCALLACQLRVLAFEGTERTPLASASAASRFSSKATATSKPGKVAATTETAADVRATGTGKAKATAAATAEAQVGTKLECIRHRHCKDLSA
jgi:hypothetical protein